MNDVAAEARNPSVTDAIIRFYRDWWLDRCGTIAGLFDSLFVIEFRAVACDVNELFEAFVDANETLERQAYGLWLKRHFGIAYLARSLGRETHLIRALVIVETEAVDSFEKAAGRYSSPQSGLTAARWKIEDGDPDSQWRWLAEGIQASTAICETAEPMFVIVGRKTAFLVQAKAEPAAAVTAGKI